MPDTRVGGEAMIEDIKPEKAATLGEIAARYQKESDELRGAVSYPSCVGCTGNWPCDTAILLAQVQDRDKKLEAAGQAEEWAEAAERELEAQRALVERLQKAGVTDYSWMGTNRVDCHFCQGCWHPQGPAKHKRGCPLILTPARALRAEHRSPQSGHKEGGDD